MRLHGVRTVVTSVEHVEIPRGGGSGVRVHQAQVARHRHHVAVSAGVHGGRGGSSGGGGVTLVVGPEHAHGRRRAEEGRDGKSVERADAVFSSTCERAGGGR